MSKKLISVNSNDITVGVEVEERLNGEVVDFGIKTVLEADFEECPNCGTSDITWGDPELDGAFIYRVHSCNSCSCSWEERYDLVRVRISKTDR